MIGYRISKRSTMPDEPCRESTSWPTRHQKRWFAAPLLDTNVDWLSVLNLEIGRSSGTVSRFGIGTVLLQRILPHTSLCTAPRKVCEAPVLRSPWSDTSDLVVLARDTFPASVSSSPPRDSNVMPGCREKSSWRQRTPLGNAGRLRRNETLPGS